MDSIVYHLPTSTLHTTQNLAFGWIGLFTYIFKMKWIALSGTYPLQYFTRHKCRVGTLDKLSSFEFFFWSSFSFLFTPIALFAAWYSLVSYPEAPTSPGFPHCAQAICTEYEVERWESFRRLKTLGMFHTAQIVISCPIINYKSHLQIAC